MKISILGPGDYSLISKYGKLNEEEVKELIEKTGELLAREGYEIMVAVDRGIAFEIAKKYKEKGGKKVYGVLPKSHEKYKEGKEDAIKPYMKIVDEKIVVDSWYHLNGEIGSLGDAAISFGLSCGTMADIVFLYFHYKYLGGKTKLLMYLPSMSQKLPREIEEKLSIKGKKYEYINSLEDMENELKNFEKTD